MIFELNEPSIEVHNIVKVVGFYEPKSGKLPYRNNWIDKQFEYRKNIESFKRWIEAPNKSKFEYNCLFLFY